MEPVVPELDYSRLVAGWGTATDWHPCKSPCKVTLAPLPVPPLLTEPPQFEYDKFVALWGDVYHWGGFQ